MYADEKRIRFVPDAQERRGMEVRVLATGSKGNAAIVSYKQTAVLIDAGISCRRITDGLKAAGIRPESLAGVFITHEHSDHVQGVKQLIKQYGLPIYSRPATCRELVRKDDLPESAFREITKRSLSVGDLTLEWFPLSHDAVDPVGFTCHGGRDKIGFLTDTGTVTERMLRMLDDSTMLVLEANHDPNMLRYGSYAPPLKERVGGDFGHLSNEASARALVMLKRGQKLQAVLAHRSEQNNTISLVEEAFTRVLGKADIGIGVDVGLLHGRQNECVILKSMQERS